MTSSAEEFGHVGDGIYLSSDSYQMWIAVNHHENKVAALDHHAWEEVVRAGFRVWDREQVAEIIRTILEKET